MSCQDPHHAVGHAGTSENPFRPAPALTCFPFRVGDPPCASHADGGPFAAHFDRGAEPLVGQVRRLGPDDAGVWRALRLEALERHPEAFGASLEEEAGLGPEAWAARLRSALVFGAERNGELIGCAGLFLEGARKKRHKAVLWGVYVRAEARGAGVGRALVERIVEAARERAGQLHTAVVCDNHPARRLYRDLGFVTYGLEPRAIEVDGRYLDEELLVLDLHGRGESLEGTR